MSQSRNGNEADFLQTIGCAIQTDAQHAVLKTGVQIRKVLVLNAEHFFDRKSDR